MAAGRPSKYRIEFIAELAAAMFIGKSVTRFCRDIRISKQCFYEWVKLHKDFGDAFEQGKDDCEAFWEDWLVENLANKDVNSTLVKLFMANRFGWSDKSESKHNVSVTQEDALKDLE